MSGWSPVRSAQIKLHGELGGKHVPGVEACGFALCEVCRSYHVVTTCC